MSKFEKRGDLMIDLALRKIVQAMGGTLSCAPRILGCRRNIPADIRLVELLAALGYGRDQRITEAACSIEAGLSGQDQGQARLLWMTHTINSRQSASWNLERTTGSPIISQKRHLADLYSRTHGGAICFQQFGL